MISGFGAAAIVYFVSMIPSFTHTLGMVAFTLGAAYIGFVLLHNFLTEDKEKHFKMRKWVISIGVIAFIINSFLPNQKTAYYMIGAYAGAEIVGSDKAKELGNTSYAIIINTLKKWQEETQQSFETVKAKPAEPAVPVQPKVVAPVEPVKPVVPAVKPTAKDIDKAIEVVTTAAETAKTITTIVNK